MIIMIRAQYYQKLPDGKIKCLLCPHHCQIATGQAGICGVRKHNEDSQLVSESYGVITSIAIDPIEKKPLRHFMNGTQTLSVGSYGCNLHCPWCQNYTISQQHPWKIQNIGPEQLVELAQSYKLPSIAFTYNEPLINYEYILQSAKLAQAHGLKTIIVTAGYINEEPWRELLPYIDAANIDLKHFYNEPFIDSCGGKIEPIKRVIEIAVGKCYVEVTTLIIPKFNDDIKQLTAMFRWLAELDPNIPLHLSRYFPQYKYAEPPTNIEFLHKVAKSARKYLSNVYVGNI